MLQFLMLLNLLTTVGATVILSCPILEFKDCNRLIPTSQSSLSSTHGDLCSHVFLKYLMFGNEAWPVLPAWNSIAFTDIKSAII